MPSKSWALTASQKAAASPPTLLALFQKAIAGEALPREINLAHPTSRDAILFPDKRTTFGVVEMTTGCGRRCQFCVPDLNPQIDMPKARIMDAVRANVRQGNKLISLATEDMFIWGQVHTDTPFFFPNREALVDLYTEIVNTPGVEQHLLSHCTMAPFVVDPELIRQLSEVLLPKSPIHLPRLSTHPQKKALVPLIGLETGSVRMARQIMPSKGVPFSIDDWPSVVLEGLRVANQNNWFPMMTLMIGNPGETDQDTRETLDLVYEMERRGPVCVSGAFDFHSAARHAHGASNRRHSHPPAQPPAMAAHDEVLEAQLAPRPVQLVGPDGLARRSVVHVALPSAQTERTQFHLATDDVRRSGAGKNPSEHGQDSCRQAARNQEPPGTDCLPAAKLPEAPAAR